MDRLDVRIELLRRYVVLAEELNFTRAAERLHIAQQVLSAQLRQLERGVGVPLLSRTSRAAHLTPAGEVFLVGARRVIAEADNAVRASREAAGHAQLLLACEIDAQWLLADRLAVFRAAHPSVDVVVVYLLDVSALRDLASSRIDAIALWAAAPDGLAEHSVTIAVEDVHIVLRADDPLADGDTVTAEQLTSHSLWMWPAITGTRARQLLVDAVDPPPNTILTVGSADGPALELMIQAVRDKGGYTFAPASYLSRMTSIDTVTRPLHPPIRIPLTLAWNSDSTPALQALTHSLRLDIERATSATP